VSLIEDALKKQRAETETAHSGSNGTSAAPPPLPPAHSLQAAAPPPAGQTGRRTLWALMVAAAIMLVIAGVIFVIPYAKRSVLRLRNAAVTAPPVGPTDAASTVIPPVTSVVPAAVAVSATSTSVPPHVPPLPPTPALPVSVTSTAAAPTTVTTAAAPHAVALPAQPAPEPAQKEPLVWPHIAVSGLMGGARGNNGTAIINGQILSTGESIEGVKIVAVTKAGVTLLYAGETRVLKIGETTD
jgi:hypothetical protein